MAYLSKKLDPVASGWPFCLKAAAPVGLLVKDADKLTLGQVTVVAPHALESTVRPPPDSWMTNTHMTHYQSLLLTARVTFAPPATLYTTTLLPEAEDPTPAHQCCDILAEETGTWKDLRDHPWPGCPNWYTDGSSFVVEGKRMAGAVVVDGKNVIWASSLPEGTSAQKGELVVLTQALRMAEGETINIYTDSRYAFATAHIHGAICKQRGLVTVAGKDIKNKEGILSLLEAIYLPKKVVIIHCPANQKGQSKVARGNGMADQMAKEAAQGAMILDATESTDCAGATNTKPCCTAEDHQLMDRLGFQPSSDGKERYSRDGRSVLPLKEGQKYVTNLHCLTHLGIKYLETLLRSSKYYVLKLTDIVEMVVKNCVPCAMTNAGHSKYPLGTRFCGDHPGAHWELDFNEIMRTCFFNSGHSAGSRPVWYWHRDCCLDYRPQSS